MEGSSLIPPPGTVQVQLSSARVLSFLARLCLLLLGLVVVRTSLLEVVCVLDIMYYAGS